MSNTSFEIILQKHWFDQVEQTNLRQLASDIEMALMFGMTNSIPEIDIKRNILLSELMVLKASTSEKKTIKKMINADDEEAIDLASALIDQLKNNNSTINSTQDVSRIPREES